MYSKEKEKKCWLCMVPVYGFKRLLLYNSIFCNWTLNFEFDSKYVIYSGIWWFLLFEFYVWVGLLLFLVYLFEFIPLFVGLFVLLIFMCFFVFVFG